MQSQEAVRQDAALKAGVELVLHELRHLCPGGRLCLGNERRGVLPHQSVQRGLVGAVTFVVERGTAGARRGCRTMASTHGSRGCDPEGTQAR
jgi:hypothetical protein